MLVDIAWIWELSQLGGSSMKKREELYPSLIVPFDGSHLFPIIYFCHISTYRDVRRAYAAVVVVFPWQVDTGYRAIGLAVNI